MLYVVDHDNHARCADRRPDDLAHTPASLTPAGQRFRLDGLTCTALHPYAARGGRAVGQGADCTRGGPLTWHDTRTFAERDGPIRTSYARNLAPCHGACHRVRGARLPGRGAANAFA